MKHLRPLVFGVLALALGRAVVARLGTQVRLTPAGQTAAVRRHPGQGEAMSPRPADAVRPVLGRHDYFEERLPRAAMTLPMPGQPFSLTKTST